MQLSQDERMLLDRLLFHAVAEALGVASTAYPPDTVGSDNPVDGDSRLAIRSGQTAEDLILPLGTDCGIVSAIETTDHSNRRSYASRIGVSRGHRSKVVRIVE